MGDTDSITTIVAKAIVALIIFLVTFGVVYGIAEPDVGGGIAVTLALIAVAIVEAAVFGILNMIVGWKP